MEFLGNKGTLVVSQFSPDSHALEEGWGAHSLLKANTVREIYNFKHQESQYSGLCWSSRGIQTNNTERAALECSEPSQVNKNTDKVARGVQPSQTCRSPWQWGTGYASFVPSSFCTALTSALSGRCNLTALPDFTTKAPLSPVSCDSTPFQQPASALLCRCAPTQPRQG